MKSISFLSSSSKNSSGEIPASSAAFPNDNKTFDMMTELWYDVDVIQR